MNDSATKSISLKIPNIKFISKLLIPLSIIMSGLLISLSLFISGLNIKNSLKNITTSSTANTVATVSPTAAPTIKLNNEVLKGLFDSNKYITFGNSSAKNLIVEFTDPSCPFCHLAGGKDPELNKQVGNQFVLPIDGGNYDPPTEEIRNLVNQGQASFAFIYTTGHQNGKLGMQALYCAYDQGKFWEAHDLLMSYNGYNLMNNDIKNDVANSSKLADFLSSATNKSAMLDCLKNTKYESRITQEDQLGQSFGVQGTPGFFINTTVFSGAVSFKDMQSAINK